MVLIPINTNPSRRNLVAIVRCKIGEDVFEVGDGALMAARVSLGEGDRSSNCSFDIYDPRQFFAQKYLQSSYDQGGLTGLGPPPGATAGVGAATGVGSFGGGSSSATEKAIVAECLRQGVSDRAQIAYILATAKHESANFTALTEFASGSAYEGRRDLGNINPGDGVKFKGRGYVQITGRANYRKYSKILGQDFEANPTGMASPNVALFTLVHGMKTGTFTGRKVGDYVGGNRRDFFNARRVVNDVDQASLISGYANQYLANLDSLMPSGQQPASGVVKPVEQSPPVEAAQKGGQISIWIGYEPDQLTEFAFIHTGTRYQGTDRHLTSFEGQSVRWLLTRRLKNATYKDITLRQLAEKVAKGYGLQLKMQGDGPRYEFLDQTGITDYALLQRECDRIGYRLYDEGPSLVVEERKGKPVGFVLEYGVNMDSFEVRDQAQTDSSGGARASEPGTSNPTGEIKTVLDPLTGGLKQKRPENKAATGKIGDALIAATGAKTDKIQPKTTGETAGADQVRQDAAKRVKGFPGSASFTTTPAALTLNPDTPFITEGHQADFLNRVWVIESVGHEWQSGNLRTSVNFYSPMAPKYADAGVAGSDSPIQGTSCNDRIYNAAIALRGMDTSSGPDGGNNACVFAVNKVLAKAGVANPWGNGLDVVTQANGLRASGATQVSASQSLPGDIVIWDDGVARGHTGIVLTPGASKVLTNSSSKARFVWEAPNNTYENYYGGRAMIFRVKC